MYAYACTYYRAKESIVKVVPKWSRRQRQLAITNRLENQNIWSWLCHLFVFFAFWYESLHNLVTSGDLSKYFICVFIFKKINNNYQIGWMALLGIVQTSTFTAISSFIVNFTCDNFEFITVVTTAHNENIFTITSFETISAIATSKRWWKQQ